MAADEPRRLQAGEAAAGFPGRGLGVQTFVIEERGRFVVFLDVALARCGGEPFDVVRRRINDYASEAEARVAARFIALGAGRELRRPPTGL